jgi:hypothetical protein
MEADVLIKPNDLPTSDGSSATRVKGS